MRKGAPSKNKYFFRQKHLFMYHHVRHHLEDNIGHVKAMKNFISSKPRSETVRRFFMSYFLTDLLLFH
ncbi:hypothetical protein BCV53_07095 [Parageobacillus thermoglucosidasius]|uniref:Uncharacterized protein n=1 Tax=Parageobacillus thermoglucosidasius TaxID=1426 RepID=A0AAN0YMG4_PARTM|nr:hypothetical protein AOT13_07085 [Parageobacillus thermoglucosidasius]ANZ29858.1 hypothetical protein BCV53_07095 [Parageobacillus thermoglucosidasius]APM80596.1 hypothetical protein BCV54_07100 [Parageobacillus thermoglucosidasius]KJX70399.1 hypothetical protein WH82_01955 [Parageobacillus thermoglucosidasius]RDE21179.1 hypothetical protein DV712_13655 [Parageobacillus thermoglucosidasius]